MPAPVQSFKKTLALVLAGALWAGAPLSAQAQAFPDYRANNEWNPTALEVLRLPSYCQPAFRPQLANPSVSAMHRACGERFNKFCPGLVALNRAGNPAGTMGQRSYILGIAEGTLRYARENMAPGCPLAAEVHAAEQRAKLLRIMVK